MIGLTLARYFFTRHMIMTGWFLAGTSALIFLIDFNEFSSRVSSLPGYRLAHALALSAMRLPFVLQQIMPFIALFSAMMTLMALNRKYELVVARSTGVSAWQFLMPIAFSAFLFGLFSVFVLNPLGAMGVQYANSVEALWKSGKSNETTASSMPWLRQKVGDDVTVIGAHAVLNGGTDLRDVSFFRLGADNGIAERIDAKRAVLENGNWNLTDIVRRAPNGDTRHEERTQIPTNLDAAVVGERIARPETIAFYDLYSKIRSASAFGYQVNSLRTQLQILLALPMLLVAMTLIAATASLRFVRFGQSLMMILGGIAAGFLLYVVSVLAKAFGSAGVVPPAAAAWFPVVVSMFFGVTYLLYREDG